MALFLKNSFTALTALYLVGLVIYLALRVTVGDGWWWLALLNNFVPYYFLPAFVLLPLALLVRDRMSVLRLLPVILIALLWFGGYFVPKARADSNGMPLKVLTFNVLGDNQLRQINDAAEWIKTQNADIVFLQEAFPEVHDGTGVLGLLEHYPYQASESKVKGYWGRGFLSRYPILEVEDLTEMGVQRLVVDVNGIHIAAYNVHFHVPMQPHNQVPFKFGNAWLNGILRYSDTRRNQQIALFLDYIQQETLPYIVAGDFNMSDQTTIYPRFAAVMTDSFREAGTGLGASWPARFVGIPPVVRLDYIWHSDDFRTLSIAQGPEIGSDHLPLYANLDLTKH